MIRAIRRFFLDQDFLEVETPLRIPAPAPESHIDAVASGEWFLQTSPELCMKRLLAAGYPQIFQICKCFRAGERGDRHLPEFTMLEWYRAGTDYRTLMDDCEALIARVAAELGFGGAFSWQGREIDLEPPWERITVREAFARYASMTADEALRRDRFDEILACEIEPRLGMETPRLPVRISGGARRPGAGEGGRSGDRRTVRTLYRRAGAGQRLFRADRRGEQRRRFEEASRDRSRNNRPVYPMPERFLAALSRMPPSAGIALGVDRLAMLFADQAGIDAVVAFPPESL